MTNKQQEIIQMLIDEIKNIPSNKEITMLIHYDCEAQIQKSSYSSNKTKSLYEIFSDSLSYMMMKILQQSFDVEGTITQIDLVVEDKTIYKLNLKKFITNEEPTWLNPKQFETLFKDFSNIKFEVEIESMKFIGAKNE